MLRASVKLRRGRFALNAQFELPTPGVVALFGRSGCGKTTLINVLAGLLKAEAAQIELDDAILEDSIRNIRVAAEKRRIGYVFQDARLFPHLNVEANLRYGLKRFQGTPYLSFEAVIALLGLGRLLNQKSSQLSGGERQRVAIGRTLLAQPRLLLLDEPLAALDAVRREEVLPYLELLRDQWAIPMVYVSHQYEEVLRLATHLVLMQSGTTIAQGDIGAMSLSPELRAIIGQDEIGAIIDGEVLGTDAAGLTRVLIGHSEPPDSLNIRTLKIRTPKISSGTKLRIQVLARDLIIATQAPEHLSVRNILKGRIDTLASDDNDSDLVTVEVGGTRLLARVTHSATRELSLRPGLDCWVLVKAISLRGYAFKARSSLQLLPGP